MRILELIATVTLPFVYLVSLLLSAYFPNQFILPNLMKLVFIVISVFGLAIWVISYLNLGLSFGVLPKPRRVIKKGLYRYLRHPMYLGISLTFLSLAFLNGSFYGLTYTLLILTPILIFRSILESKEIQKINHYDDLNNHSS